MRCESGARREEGRLCVCVRTCGEEEGCQRQSESQREEEKESAERKGGEGESGNLRERKSRAGEPKRWSI